MLILASVLGREFALAPLARIAGVSEDELLDVLDEAMAARVAADVPAGGGRLRFSHALIRDTLYDGLTSARRVILHRRAVTALETVYGEQPGPHLSELAHHAFAGREFDQARRYAQRAGDRALALLAFEESARLYETAIEALGSARPERRAGTVCAVALARRGAGTRGPEQDREAHLPGGCRARPAPRLGARARPRGGGVRRPQHLRARR